MTRSQEHLKQARLEPRILSFGKVRIKNMLVKFNQAMLCWVTQEFRLRRVRLDPIKRFSLGKDLER
jgi:hypothetical protein